MSDDRCCCSICHVKTGTWIIAIVQFVSAVLGLINAVLALGHVKEDSADRSVLIGQIVISALWVLVIILLCIGLNKNKPLLILPHLIITVIYVMLMVASTVLLIINGAEIGTAIAAIILALIILGLLWVEWRCYKYISAIA